MTGKQPIGLEYKQDPTRPGGGVFVAHGEAKKREGDFRDVPEGVIIRSSSDDETEADDKQGVSSAPISDERGRDDRERASMMSSSAFAPPLPSDVGIMGGTSSRSPDPAGDVRGSSLLQSTRRNTLQMQPGETPRLGPSSIVNFTPLSGATGGATQRNAMLANVNPAMNTHALAESTQVQVMNPLDGQSGASGTLAELQTVDSGFLDGIPGGMFDWGKSWLVAGIPELM